MNLNHREIEFLERLDDEGTVEVFSREEDATAFRLFARGLITWDYKMEGSIIVFAALTDAGYDRLRTIRERKGKWRRLFKAFFLPF